MKIFKGVRIKCTGCGRKEHVGVTDGQFFDPAEWVKKGADVLCPRCADAIDEVTLHPHVKAAAEKLVHSIQALMATELVATPPPGTALTYGTNGMQRRMKRCELLARYADCIMTVYGNVVGFRLASEGAFGHTTLGEVATNCETLMKAEVAFSAARANKRKPYNPTSGLSSTYSPHGDDDYGSVSPRIAGPLYRLGEVSKVAQKLAQLAATRAGEVVGTPEGYREDIALDRALDDIGVFADGDLFMGRGAVGNPQNEAQAAQRQLIMMAQRWMEKTEERAEKAEAMANQPIGGPIGGLFGRDPLYELEHLLETKTKLEAAGRLDAVKSIEARILLAEAQLRAQTEATTVDSALAAEASSKDVTPVVDAPPDEEEIAHLRRTIGDDAVRSGFPDIPFKKAVYARADIDAAGFNNRTEET